MKKKKKVGSECYIPTIEDSQMYPIVESVLGEHVK
jgi:hypothetical protein